MTMTSLVLLLLYLLFFSCRTFSFEIPIQNRLNCIVGWHEEIERLCQENGTWEKFQEAAFLPIIAFLTSGLVLIGLQQPPTLGEEALASLDGKDLL